MRQIKFRGKLISDDFRTRYKNGWIYGDYIKNDISHFIISEFEEGSDNSGYPSIDITFWQKVIPETVGQFIGVYDKNGTEIYEGDIIKAINEYYDGETNIGEVHFEDFTWFGAKDYLDYINNYCLVEVIGNIHDNPELLEREGN